MRGQSTILSLFISLLIGCTSAFSHPSSFATKAALTAAFLSATDETMVAEVKVGDKIPDVVLTEGQTDYGKPTAINIAELIKGKKVAIFAVPGAFTPGCSKSHLPSFIEAQEELKAKGVELTICVATNDAFVMEVRKTIIMIHSFAKRGCIQKLR